MAIIKRTKFKCPECEETFDADMYKSVSVDEDPKYRQMLINGDFFKFTCPKCGKTFLAVYPLSYTDTKNKFLIQYTPRNIKDSVVEAVKTNRANLPEDYFIRVCEATYDAVEKVVIFEKRLDDRAVECCKVVIHKAFLDKYPGKVVNHIYLNFDNNGNYFYDVLFNNEEGKQVVSRAPFDFKLYNKVYRDFRKDFKDEDLIVDYGYGLKLMTRPIDDKKC